jgi:hypothetical protein
MELRSICASKDKKSKPLELIQGEKRNKKTQPDQELALQGETAAIENEQADEEVANDDMREIGGDIELGEVALSPVGITIGAIEFASGELERIEFDLENCCNGIA